MVAQAQDLIDAGGDRLAAAMEVEFVHVGRVGQAPLGIGIGFQHRGRGTAIHGAQIAGDRLVGRQGLAYRRPGRVQALDQYRLSGGQDVTGEGGAVEAVDGADTSGGEGFEHTVLSSKR